MTIKSKKSRLNLIKALIKDENVRTQGRLVRYLQNKGYDVTQATVSRDISEIGLMKNRDGYYVLAEEIELKSIFTSLVKGVGHSANIVVVNTMPGAGQTVASFIDKVAIKGILGSVAGDDTIFLLIAENLSSKEVVKKLRSFKRLS